MSQYPTDEELDIIKNWPCEDYHGLMAFIEPLWEFESFRKLGDDIYRLATSGWSGNEDIIGALMENTMFWMMYWAESRRGGLFIFAPCTMKTIEELEKLHEENKI